MASPNKKILHISSPEAEKKLATATTHFSLQEKEHEVQTLAREFGLPYLSLEKFPINQEALELVSEEDAKRLQLIPFLLSGREIRIGVIDPNQPGLHDFLQELQTQRPGHYVMYLLSPHSFDLGLEAYAHLPKVRAITPGVQLTEDDLKRYQDTMKDFGQVNKLLAHANVTELMAIVISGALEMRASDIHIEAADANIQVRYRIDGTLYTVAEIGRQVWPQLISRLKLLAKLKLNISATPQDGRFSIHLTNDTVDVRVSTIPTAYGESVVMRLLRASSTGLAFDQLGLRGKAYDDLKREIQRPNGMIMATGPTGSGKTTTLYAILNQLNDSETKIITLEDPIEYKLKGVNQSQIDHAAGYDFAKGLKAILRQDPDIVMVGEIRDYETSDIAINAALTGHLVISTIHTNNAAGALPRFLAMGVKPFLLAPALNCIIGQRLVRRICDQCKEETQLDPDTLQRVKKSLNEISPQSGYQPKLTALHFYHGKGCAACNNLGYKGRMGIYEILTMNQEIEKIILSGQVSEYTMQEVAVKYGMITMVQDGLLKAIEGITTVEEVFAVAE